MNSVSSSGKVSDSAHTNTEQIALKVASRWEKGTHTLDYLLEREFERSKANPSERAKITEWVYNWGRSRGSARFLLDASLDRGLDSLAPKLRIQLEITICRLLHEERTPKPIIVSTAVEHIKQTHGNPLAKLANAVLRKIADKPLPWPEVHKDPVHYLVHSRSHPVWIVERWLDRWGFERTQEQLDWDNRRPQLWLRYNRLRLTLDEATSKLQEADVGFEPSTGHTGYFRLTSSFYPEAASLVRSGYFSVQDPSASLSVRLLAPHKEMRILDLCAAPGGKTTLIAELADDAASIVAIDASADRLRMLNEATDRLGITSVRTLVADGRNITGNLELQKLTGSFDAVLVDVPCSGFGVLNRRADLRWRRKPEDFANLIELQRSLIRAGAQMTRAGGVLVYSTCSIEPEENEEIVQEFLSGQPEFTVTEEINTYSPGDGIDGVYAAHIIRQP